MQVISNYSKDKELIKRKKEKNLKIWFFLLVMVFAAVVGRSSSVFPARYNLFLQNHNTKKLVILVPLDIYINTLNNTELSGLTADNFPQQVLHLHHKTWNLQ